MSSCFHESPAALGKVRCETPGSRLCPNLFRWMAVKQRNGHGSGGAGIPWNTSAPPLMLLLHKCHGMVSCLSLQHGIWTAHQQWGLGLLTAESMGKWEPETTPHHAFQKNWGGQKQSRSLPPTQWVPTWLCCSRV